jgi:hypothetical protein
MSLWKHHIDSYETFNSRFKKEIEIKVIQVDSVLDEDFIIPQSLENEITLERNKEYIQLFQYLNYDYKPLNNILMWTLITDIVEPFMLRDHSMSLAVKCEYPFPIALILVTSCNEIYMDIIYDTVEIYLKELEQWKNRTPSNVNIEAIKEYYDTDDTITIDKEPFANKLTTFQEYISVMKDMSFIDLNFK